MRIYDNFTSSTAFSLIMISSRNNPRIKNIVKLAKASERRRQNLFVIEGEREILRARTGGIAFQELLICPAVTTEERAEKFLADFKTVCETELVSREAFEKMAYREGSDGLIATARPVYRNPFDLTLSQNPLIIILESVEKPGNLGAVMRTADAAGVDAVIISDPSTDIYNPNVIRSSVGCIFTVPVALCSTAEAIDWLKQESIESFATSLEASELYTRSEFTKASAIVMGTEATGLSEQWLLGADHRIIIPMNGVADSLNVSTAAAIVVFEAMRQRQQ
jgi:TrmH family RNA methyltransferase